MKMRGKLLAEQLIQQAQLSIKREKSISSNNAQRLEKTLKYLHFNTCQSRYEQRNSLFCENKITLID